VTDERPLILIVEDEPQIRRFVRSALEEENCRVVEAGSAATALEQMTAAMPALVVLDLGLPDRDGVVLIRELRAWSAVPVLVLSARSAEDEKIAALDAGADDYLTKPFGVGELRARLRAMLRRLGAAASEPVVRFGDVRVDHVHRNVERGGIPVHLTPIEYRLLCLMIANAGKVLTHRHLLRDVWGPGCGERSHYLRVYVGHLRQKLEADPARPKHLLTETGVGYRFQL
jgi:two-component system, OmpR family, KDP operon response regulator KdpE